MVKAKNMKNNDYMSDEQFIETAKTCLTDYFRNVLKVKLSESECKNHIAMTWYSYIAGNYKAMFCVVGYQGDTDPQLTDRYYEVTYIKSEDNIMIDEYLSKNNC